MAGMIKIQGQSQVQLIAAVLCFLLAGLVWALTRPHNAGINDVPADAMTWTLCISCEHSQEMSLRDFFEQQQQEMIRKGNMSVPALLCPNCGQHSVFKAIQCTRCSHIFIESETPGDFYDRCPECQYSPTEERRTNQTTTH